MPLSSISSEYKSTRSGSVSRSRQARCCDRVSSRGVDVERLTQLDQPETGEVPSAMLIGQQRAITNTGGAAARPSRSSRVHRRSSPIGPQHRLSGLEVTCSPQLTAHLSALERQQHLDARPANTAGQAQPRSSSGLMTLKGIEQLFVLLRRQQYVRVRPPMLARLLRPVLRVGRRTHQ